MPSTVFASAVSGGQPLVSGDIYSGVLGFPHQVDLMNSLSGIGSVFVCTPNLSGDFARFNSGGSLSSGGLADGWELARGQTMSLYRGALVSGIQSIRLVGPTDSSGTRIYWKPS